MQTPCRPFRKVTAFLNAPSNAFAFQELPAKCQLPQAAGRRWGVGKETQGPWGREPDLRVAPALQERLLTPPRVSLALAPPRPLQGKHPRALHGNDAVAFFLGGHLVVRTQSPASKDTATTWTNRALNKSEWRLLARGLSPAPSYHTAENLGLGDKKRGEHFEERTGDQFVMLEEKGGCR